LHRGRGVTLQRLAEGVIDLRSMSGASTANEVEASRAVSKNNRM